MTLGNRITALRSKHHMSQGDLAERLNVSRQSVSKWETDTSVPDLDKLITLSEIFGITLDELVKGPQTEEEISTKTAENTSHNTTENSIHSNSGKYTDSHAADISYTYHTGTDSDTDTSQPSRVSDTQRTIGFILITVGLLGIILSMIFTANLLLLMLLLVLFGIICLTIKRHAGLVIGWIILLPAFFILPWMTGITPLNLLYMFGNLGDAKINLSMMLAAIYWFCVLILLFITWRTFRKKIHS